MDFYTSPIVAEVDGVDIRVKVSHNKAETDDIQKGKGSTVGEDIVPTAADLAQSFLETQPPAEKKQLEEAIAAETQDLGASILSESESSDDDSTTGTGQPLSLPVFLTDFLQGIVDRMQIRIGTVTFQGDVEVPVDPDVAAPETVTFQLSLESINVEGVTTLPDTADGNSGTHAVVHKDGKRHILLNNIRAALISEANVFASLGPSPSMHSSLASKSPVASEEPRAPNLAESVSRRSGYGSLAGSAAQLQPLSSSRQSSVRDSEEALGIPYDFGEDETDEQEEQGGPASSLSTPRASFHQDLLRERPTALSRDPAKSTVVERFRGEWSTYEREARSEPDLRPPEGFSLSTRQSPQESIHSSGSASAQSSRRASIEDLTQSQLYSHEDAESMYMSAFSEVGSSKMRTAMPGAWEDSEDSQQQDEPPKDEEFGTRSAAASTPPLEGPPQARERVESEPAEEGGEPPQELLQQEIEQLPELSAQEPEPAPQDDVPTPRGPTRLAKEIMLLDSISVYLPTAHKHLQVTTPDLARSVSPNVPGAFSVRSAAGKSQILPVTPARAEHSSTDGAIEVIMKPLDIRFDASTGFLLAKVISRLLEALRQSSEPTRPAHSSNDRSDATPSTTTSPLPDLRITLEALSIQFLEKLAGVADTPSRIFSRHNDSTPGSSDFPSDVLLLQAKVSNLHASVTSHASGQPEANITAEKVSFGYADDDILAFDRSVQLFESIANTLPSAGSDIAVRVRNGPEEVRVEVNTLPLHVKLDLQRLDETFSWFGGLSSFINMGTSSATPGQKLPPPKPQKGVRFETPDEEDRARGKEQKVDLRINGTRVDVIGKDCSLLLNTSALKLVSRGEGIGMHFSRIRLSGPYLRSSSAVGPPILTEVENTRVDFMFSPRPKDLERLLELITPSRHRFDEREDEIMVDTLLRQRRKGSVLSLTVGRVKIEADKPSQLACLPSLADDLAKLGTVAKYLPEDDRPGLLTLCHVREIDVGVDLAGRMGTIQGAFTDLEIAHITVPALVAVALGRLSVRRNGSEELVYTSPAPTPSSVPKPPVVMMRLIDDLEPVLKVNLMGLAVEYRVPTIMDLLGLGEDATPQEFEAGLAASVANLGERAQAALKGTAPSPEREKDPLERQAKQQMKLDVKLLDCVVGLNPLGLKSKLAVVLTDGRLEASPGGDGKQGDTVSASLALKKAAILLVDDVAVLSSTGGSFTSTRRSHAALSAQAAEMCAKGYVSICQISSARMGVKAMKDPESGDTQLEVEVRDDLLVLETCADSTQTLIGLANALAPPTPPSRENKFRTEVVPVEDLLASITADAFGRAEGDYDFDRDFAAVSQDTDAGSEGEDFFAGGGGGSGASSQLHFDPNYYDRLEGEKEALFDATEEEESVMMAGDTRVEETSDGVLLSNTADSGALAGDSSSEELTVQENYFAQRRAVQGTAHRWNSAKNTYDRANDDKIRRSPLKVSVRDVHVIWHLFDGYDWARTREVITKAVQDVEARAYERRRARGDRRRRGFDEEDEEEAVIEDFLFNSIYIGIPAGRDPKELSQAINEALHDTADTETVMTTPTTTTSARPMGHRRTKSKNGALKLGRSKHHKITFELKGVNVDLVVFPPGSGETLNSIDVRVGDLDIFDHMPTSTWKKFATYDMDAGEREQGASMVHLELLNVRPVPSTPASEIVLKVSVLPLRLHVDQDALDFITRFFEFKDDNAAPSVPPSPSDIPFIQRAEINDIPVRLDFKPKRVDYAGLRSGRTTEFMNFVILEDARMVLRHVILYGVSGFDRLGKQLNDIWMDNVKRTQLPSVLAGVGPFRSVVNAGAGIRDLIEIPIREYRKDGRIVRSIKKGATAFARTTGIEAVRLGAKLAIGTQNALQNAEGLLAPPSSSDHHHHSMEDWDASEAEDLTPDEVPPTTRKTSLYADQPLGIVQGMRVAYRSLARDLAVARDAIIAVPAEVMETGSAQGAAKVVLRRAPTIILRPAIGATKAIGQTLLGATNSLDPGQRRRVEAVSFCYPEMLTLG